MTLPFRACAKQEAASAPHHFQTPLWVGICLGQKRHPARCNCVWRRTKHEVITTEGILAVSPYLILSCSAPALFAASMIDATALVVVVAIVSGVAAIIRGIPFKSRIANKRFELARLVSGFRGEHHRTKSYCMKKTVVELDLKGYSDIVVQLEEHLSAEIVLQLNDQIQGFVRFGLQAVGCRREQSVIATTGDGAILVFDRAADAHRFAVAVHDACTVHNSKRTISSACRWFRVGIATGDLAVEADGSGRSVGGSVIARAVRLEAAGTVGEIVVDKRTYDELPEELRAGYGPEEQVVGKREEAFSVRRCAVLRQQSA